MPSWTAWFVSRKNHDPCSNYLPFRYYRPCLQLAGWLGGAERPMVTSVKTPGNCDVFSTHIICTTWIVNSSQKWNDSLECFVGMATTLRTGWSGVWIPVGGQGNFSSPQRPGRLLGPSMLLFIEYRGQFQAVKRPAQQMNRSSPCITLVKNEWSCGRTPPCLFFLAWGQKLYPFTFTKLKRHNNYTNSHVHVR